MVLTSGNVSDEPIVYRDGEAAERLGGIADAFLTHDRAIHIRTDDSVVRAFRGREAVAPPVPRLRAGAAGRGDRFARPVLACGAELKSTFCLARDGHAFVSHHIGDLENAETLRSFTEGIEHFRRLFDITPEVVAHDLHPEYLSTKYAAHSRMESGWRGRPGRCGTRRRPASPRAHRVLPGRQPGQPGRSSGWPSTAPATGRTAPSGAASS